MRNVPSARPKRLLAPSATIVYSARIVDVRAVRALDVGAAHEAALDQRVQRLVALQEPCPGGFGVRGDEPVELAPAHDVAVLRVHRVRRPLELELPTHARRPQAVVAVEALELVAEAHVVELLDGPRGQAVAARLLAGNVLRSTIVTSWPWRANQYAGGRAGGPATDDEDVGRDRGR